MKCAWGFHLVCGELLLLASFCRAGRYQRGMMPKENSGVVRLHHGAFNCMGALLTSKIVLTCCTCVSDVYFNCDPETDDQVTYEVRALNPENVTVKSEDERRVPAKEVFIHPQCDIDGTYDYGLVTLTRGISGKAGSGDCLMALRRSFKTPPLSHFLETRKRMNKLPTGICTMHTILEETYDGEITQILTRFVDWKHCWNGSETKPTFESKFCIETVDSSISIENAKCGSPVYCDHKLQGVVARRYALGGRQFSSVNGLEGAIEFIKETVNLDIEEETSGEEYETERKKLSKKTRNQKRKARLEKKKS